MRRTTRVSLGAVAAAAAVSKATASKVFNGRHDVAPATRERVLATAASLGYEPPARVAPGSSPQVWVAFTSFVNPYLGLLLDGMLAEAQSCGITVVTTQWSPGVEYRTPAPASTAWLRQGVERGVSAFVLVTTPVTAEHVRVARTAGVPLMVVDPLGTMPAGALSVAATNFRGGVHATEHLVSLGHRRIAFVGAPPQSAPGRERLAGYRDALEVAGIAPEPGQVLPGSFSVEDGHAVASLLRRRDRPSAVFAANDLVACGALEAARTAGLAVPDDLSVVGFDDTVAASVSAPPLTTVRQPLVEMGALAMRTCVGVLGGTRPATPHVELATELVVRGSTGPLRS